MTSALLSEALAPLKASPDRSAVLLDIDGTLAPIVDHASDANVPEATRQLLIAVARRYAVVACVSGRRASEARVADWEASGDGRLPANGEDDVLGRVDAEISGEAISRRYGKGLDGLAFLGISRPGSARGDAHHFAVVLDHVVKEARGPAEVVLVLGAGW